MCVYVPALYYEAPCMVRRMYGLSKARVRTGRDSCRTVVQVAVKTASVIYYSDCGRSVTVFVKHFVLGAADCQS